MLWVWNPPLAPGVPVAVNVTGEPESPADVADKVFWPGTGPSVQLPTVAMPEPLVFWLAPVIDPPPPVTANVTATPETAPPCASVTFTAGATGTALPAVAD
jgi:hypothetical protein